MKRLAVLIFAVAALSGCVSVSRYHRDLRRLHSRIVSLQQQVDSLRAWEMDRTPFGDKIPDEYIEVVPTETK